jgi:hypothetical protein
MKGDPGKVVWAETISAMRGSGCEPHLPGTISRVRLHADSCRTVITGIKNNCVEMIDQAQAGYERFMIVWHAVLVGWIACWKQGVENTMELAFTYKANVAHLYGLIWFPWSWHPQGMSV